MQMFCKIGVLKNFAVFTGKKAVLESLFNKLQFSRSATFLKKYSNTGVFL